MEKETTIIGIGAGNAMMPKITKEMMDAIEMEPLNVRNVYPPLQETNKKFQKKLNKNHPLNKRSKK